VLFLCSDDAEPRQKFELSSTLEREPQFMSDEQNEEQAPKAPANEPKTPSHGDLILTALQNSVQVVLDLDKNPNRAKSITQGLDAFVEERMPKSPDAPADDKCAKPDPVTAPLCAQLKFSQAQANTIFGTAESGAANDLHVAVGAWKLSVSQYEFTTQSAMATLDAAVEEAKEIYAQALKPRPDSASRNLVLWYQMQASVLTGTIAYESSLASAASTLANSAGALLAEYATYIAAISSAEATRLSSLSAANQTFWQGVETGRDG
jgi:hypothetical protein